MTRLRPGSPAILAATAAVLLIGVGLAVLGSSLSSGATEARLLGGGAANAPINREALHKADLTAANSPSITANPADPANLVVVNRVDLPTFSCGLHRSADGGASWSDTQIPIPAGEEPKCYAPDAAFGRDGTLYVSFVTLKGVNNEPNAVWLTSSSDHGATLSPPTAVSGPHAYQVRLATDPNRSSRVYVSWVQADQVGNLRFSQPGNPISVVRSDDGGVSWGPTVLVTPTTRLRALAPSPAVGPDGQVYLLYLDLRDDDLDYAGAHNGNGGDPYPGRWGLILARSGDQGQTWSETTVDSTLVPTTRIIVFLPQFPSLAIDQQSGRIYAAFHDSRAGDPDVYLWVSEDGGRSFQPPRRVNDTPTHDGTAQYLPRLATAPNGRLDVIYYDRRRDSTEVMNEVSLQSSSDGGRTFSPSLRITTQPFDSRIGFGSERGLPDLGSRLALLSTDSRALGVWTDTRAGSEASGKQDLARAVVAFSTSGSAARTATIIAGLVLAALGMLGLVAGLAGVSIIRPGRSRKG